jgi:hypothetical protein
LTVSQFFGADADSTSLDIIRMIYESGTTSTRSRVIRQLRAYLETVTIDRLDIDLLGVAHIQNEVYLFKNIPNAETFGAVYPHWISFFDPRFVNELNAIRDFGYARDLILQ